VHVLLEKPMTVTVEEADELIAIASRTGAVLQIGHIERFNPALTAIKPHLRSPRYLQAERSAPFTVRCTDVNVVLDLMIHDLDIVTDVAGSRPRAVSAAGASIITGGVDAVIARIAYENGCMADVTASRVSDEKKRVLKVFDGDQLFTADYQAQAAFRSARGAGTVPELATTRIPTERRDTLADEIASFIDCIRTGTRPAVGGPEGRSALALAAMITRNIEQGISDFVPLS
jgi:predicted dehydrogenase